MDLTIRPRRLRGSESIRRLCRETRMSPDSLIYPIFVDETLTGKRRIPSLAGQYHYGLDTVVEAVEAEPLPAPAGYRGFVIRPSAGGAGAICSISIIPHPSRGFDRNFQKLLPRPERKRDGRPWRPSRDFPCRSGFTAPPGSSSAPARRAGRSPPACAPR